MNNKTPRRPKSHAKPDCTDTSPFLVSPETFAAVWPFNSQTVPQKSRGKNKTRDDSPSGSSDGEEKLGWGGETSVGGHQRETSVVFPEREEVLLWNIPVCRNPITFTKGAGNLEVRPPSHIITHQQNLHTITEQSSATSPSQITATVTLSQFSWL